MKGKIVGQKWDDHGSPNNGGAVESPCWTAGTLISFDTETSGPDPETARIVTASVVIIDGTTGKVDRHEWLAAVDDEIPAEATAVHGITTEYAREHGQSPRDVAADVCRLLADELETGAPLIAYNVSYDATVLDRECRRYGLPTLHERAADDGIRIRIVDPLVLDRALDRYRKGKRTLAAVSAHYGVPIAEADAHGSTADALCAARVAWKIGRKYPAECADLDALQGRQTAWHRQWADHFGAYLTQQGKPDDVAREWPLRTLAEATA